MNHYLLWPPLAFLLILAASLALRRGLAIFAPQPQQAAGGKNKAYACGEDIKQNRVQPDYSQFFPFAFFFTIMHVLALVVATVPAQDWSAVQLAAGYLLSSAIGLFILFRR